MADPTPPTASAPDNTSAQASPDAPAGQTPDAQQAAAPPAEAPSPAAAADGAGGPPPWRAPSFLQSVNLWVSGKDAPTDAVSVGCLEDLRSNLAERQQTQQQAAQIEQALREAQAKVISSQGSEEALLRVLYRAQAAASGAAASAA